MIIPSLFLLIWTAVGSSGDVEELNVLVMAPYSNSMNAVDTAWNVGPALVAAARLAAHQINQRQDLLRGYRLKLVERESGCTFTSKTIINFVEAEFHNLSASERFVGVIGPGCLQSVKTLGSFTQDALKLVQISISSSAELSGDAYTNLFRTVPSTLVYIDAFKSLIEAANWKEVAVIYDNQDPKFSSIVSELHARISSDSWHCFELRPELHDHVIVFDVLKEVDSRNLRVVLALVGLDQAQSILCNLYLYKSKLIEFQVIFIDLDRKDILNVNFFVNKIEFFCSQENLESIMNNTIIINNNYRRKDLMTNNTVAQISYDTYQDLYKLYLEDYLQEKNINASHLPSIGFHYANAFYDAMWSLSIALNYTASAYNLTNLGKENYADVFSSNPIRDHIRDSVRAVHLEGMSGKIFFNHTTRGVSNLGVKLTQFVFASGGINDTHMATFINGSLTFDGDDFTFFSYTLETVHYNTDFRIGAVVLVLALLAVIGFTAIHVALMFLNLPEVKASSPQLNYLILSGCFFYLISLILFTLQESFSNTFARSTVISAVACNMQIWCFSFAFSLIFGTVCAKTWRIYRIFTHFKQGRVKYVSDGFLVSFVLFLLLLDFAYLIAWTLRDPWYWEGQTRREEKHLAMSYRCLCSNFAYWSIALLLQKLVLIFLSILLSIMVKPVKRKGFKNTKAILLLIYSLIIIHVVGISLYVLLDILQTLRILRFLGYALVFTFSLITVSLSQFLSDFLPNIRRKMKHSGRQKTILESRRSSFAVAKQMEL